MSKNIFIETKHLLLRQWKMDDTLPYAALNADLKVMEHFPSTLTVEESSIHLKKMQTSIEEKGFGLFALELKETGNFIGFTGLSVPNFESDFTPCIEIGWRIASPYWRNGYAFEAASACLEFGFSQLGLSEIFSFTACPNHPSENLMIKLGMKKWGHFDHPKLPDGHHLKTHVVYSINKNH